ncbi:hypothetical protein J7E97_08960 [Streptomyces sp. ISL-66]|nr:hypothetical protein [Streptomyces sp. ISL-66]MBT2468005.1 hypothetical protein [Streptomyces sp. ISL-66]
MPIDPYLALNALLRAEAARFSPPAPQSRPCEPEPAKTPETQTEDAAAE